ncbi:MULTISPECIES: phospholipase D family nuclease [Burkholderia]|uniref:phospholipase D family nuclease n=1 Tax=Burkholderia TaxID=32008 RepID=UPI00075A8F59|nr:MULTISPECIES: phospholipase D family protein [Burkholderia]AOJ68623.1 endonuclease [Burkholderia savannae]AOJ80581.1 endonuclease [Burkholderia savannae]KVG49835.1 endonuclease [Burkholderia sp. MSMB0265]KVG83563.1 endonuclease [Burkholderia sp. MSMB2040]KVG94362.1 endonuclease [Burkholderia sp. MSMB2041]
MQLPKRLAAACLAAVFLSAAPPAVSKTASDSLIARLFELIADALPSPSREAPAGQVVEAAFSPDGGAETLVLKVIGAARASIRLAGYSFTSPKVVRALLDAHRRGVDVAIVVDNDGNRSKASKQALNLLVNAKVPTRTIDRYAIHHDKYIVVDGRHVETGSFNYSAAAAARNSENVLVVWNNPALAAQYLKHWQNRFDQGANYRSAY